MDFFFFSLYFQSEIISAKSLCLLRNILIGIRRLMVGPPRSLFFLRLKKEFLLQPLLTGQVLHSPSSLVALCWMYTNLSPSSLHWGTQTFCNEVWRVENTTKVLLKHAFTACATLLFFLLLYFIACILLSSCAKLNYIESNSNRLFLVFWLCTCCHLCEYISGSLYSGVMLFEIYNLQRWIIQFSWNLN